MAWHYIAGPQEPIRVWRNDEESHSRWTEPENRRQPKWVVKISAVLFFVGAIWAIQGMVIPWDPTAIGKYWVKGAPFFHQPTQEEIEYQWQIIGRLNNCALMPEIRPVRPTRLAVSNFYDTQVKPLWQKTAAQKEQYFLEDYFDDLDKMLVLCQANFMPLLYPLAVETYGIGMEEAEWLATQNGWRQKENQQNPDLGLVRLKRQEEYTRWYEQATAIGEPDFDWLMLGQWLLFTYLKGMVISYLVFLIRLKGDPRSSIKQELVMAPLRFAKMLLGWPVYLFIYPYYTDTAMELRRLRLKAEYLRDKPISYRLTAAENAYRPS